MRIEEVDWDHVPQMNRVQAMYFNMKHCVKQFCCVRATISATLYMGKCRMTKLLQCLHIKLFHSQIFWITQHVWSWSCLSLLLSITSLLRMR